MSRVGMLAVVLAAALARPAVAQPTGRYDPGTDYFRAILHYYQLRPVDDFAKLNDNPADKIAVVFGRTRLLHETLSADGLRRLVNRGMALIIATDLATTRAMRDQFGFAIDGRFITVPESSNSGYQQLPKCPLVRAPRGRTDSTKHPLLKDNTVATNKPSWISTWQPTNHLIVAEFSGDALWSNGIPFKQAGPFAIEGRIGRGRYLVLADHSVFINEMLGKVPQNIQFAANVVNWASEGRKRTEVLFFEDDRISAEFPSIAELDRHDLPMPPPEALVPIINHAIAGLEREDFFNKLLLEIIPHNQILRILALLATVALTVYGLYRVLKARHRTDPRAPRLPDRLAVLAGTAPAAERRQQALLRGGNLAETARELARQEFAAIGMPSETKATPSVIVDGSWYEKWFWRRRVSSLWRLASGRGADSVSPRRLLRIARRLTELRAAVNNDTVRFVAL